MAKTTWPSRKRAVTWRELSRLALTKEAQLSTLNFGKQLGFDLPKVGTIQARAKQQTLRLDSRARLPSGGRNFRQVRAFFRFESPASIGWPELQASTRFFRIREPGFHRVAATSGKYALFSDSRARLPSGGQSFRQVAGLPSSAQPTHFVQRQPIWPSHSPIDRVIGKDFQRTAPRRFR